MEYRSAQTLLGARLLLRSIPMQPSMAEGFSTSAYFDLVRSGEIGEDDRVELLEGVIVASPPQGPLHAAVLTDVLMTLIRTVGDRGVVRTQAPFLAGERSVPEPDIAVVPGQSHDYRERHPDTALLVVEISDSSLPQDRLTKSRIYAAAAVPEYWIVNLRDRVLEVLTAPVPSDRVYAAARRLGRGESVTLRALPDVTVTVSDLITGY
jgi:Uma2 family endonuclease